ncbi:ceramide glucosyltransferase [Agrobacterium bohemicum]|uniref:Ceramide glucosyltransferase n=2 Tax=Agrobacterium bohemicum TaxID=2052828 RepID=A0A135P692_9HYPH|nr:glycosyltransferase [Agrobacterium bohemicum]KXG86953.1 ceramide glucosyltransferase [Agrobacterium bohemicum]
MPIAAAIASAMVVFHLLSIVIAYLRLSRTEEHNALSREKPSVSVVIPLRGIEAFSSLTIDRAFHLDWPNYELIFCVADYGDPVVAEVKAFMLEHQKRRVVLLVGDDKFSANPKLNNCAKGWHIAQHEWVILADSNVLMAPDYISRLISAWQPLSGVVCSPPLGTRPRGFWAEVECAFLNTYQARYQYAAEAAGAGFAQGKSMLWYKPFLDANGGIDALGAEIAEDAAATKLVRAAGRSVHLVSQPVEQPLGQRSLKEVWSRQARWARLRRATFPQFYVPEVLVGSVPPLCLAMAAAVLFDLNAISCVILLLAVASAMYVPELALARLKGWPVSRYLLPALITRDLILPMIWLWSWMGHSVSWRGNLMTVKPSQNLLKTTET